MTNWLVFKHWFLKSFWTGKDYAMLVPKKSHSITAYKPVVIEIEFDEEKHAFTRLFCRRMYESDFYNGRFEPLTY